MNAEQVAETIRELDKRIEESRNNYDRHSAFIIAREIVRAIANRNKAQHDKNNG